MLFFVPVEIKETPARRKESMEEKEKRKEIERMVLLERREREMEKEGDF